MFRKGLFDNGFIGILTLITLGFFCIGAASAKDDKEEKLCESADYTKVYLLTANDSKQSEGDQFYDKIKNGGKPSKDSAITFKAIKKTSEADDMKCGFMLQLVVTRGITKKIRLNDKLPGLYVNWIVSGAELRYKLYKAINGDWKKQASGKTTFFDMSGVSPLQQASFIVLSCCLKLKCKYKNDGKGDDVNISGKITNTLPFDLKNIEISTSLSPSIPIKAPTIMIVKDLKAGESSEFNATGPRLYRYSDGLTYLNTTALWDKSFIFSVDQNTPKKKSK